MKSEKLNFLEPSGPLQACNGTALPFYISISYVFQPIVWPSSARRKTKDKFIKVKTTVFFFVDSTGTKSREIRFWRGSCSFAMPVYILITRYLITTQLTLILYCFFFSRYLMNCLKMAVYNQKCSRYMEYTMCVVVLSGLMFICILVCNLLNCFLHSSWEKMWLI